MTQQKDEQQKTNIWDAFVITIPAGDEEE